ncbi:probable G-protein coupled receptor Mth-like 11 [Drosophila navojoa]|uniref:probable G-protein coupled receptor Mth-like 11 n=1 Tax=Drosophila navojoa TaxID=7232 RepID=UPI0011BE9B80|nr:probable G-protein coupled receptor Mth-like 11 [Drosophila navojoa]
MRFVLIVLSVIIAEISGDIPGCDYFDTVDLSNSTQLADGSYVFKHIKIPKGKTGKYNYQIMFDGTFELIPEHTRGCVCQLMSCVRFCCEPQKTLVKEKRECVGNIPNYNPLVNVTFHNGTEAEIDIVKEFAVQLFGIPCESHFTLDPYTNPNEGWILYENGRLYRKFDGRDFGKQHYCMQPHKSKGGQYRLLPHQCNKPQDNTDAYIQIVSVVFMILTIAAHFCMPDFRSPHKQFSICFFISLTLSFSLLRIETFLRNYMKVEVCFIFACISYYAVMCTFLWLLIINFNSWQAIKEYGRLKVNVRKRHLFVWLTAALLLLISISIDFIMKNVDKDRFLEWRPGFTVYSCWINTADWSAMIFYHGPMLVILLANIGLFVRTAWTIYKENETTRAMWKRSENMQKSKNRANFKVFLKLFLISGVVWLLEVISYLTSCFDSELNMTWIEVPTSAQGIVIFVVTVLKKNELNSIYKR